MTTTFLLGAGFTYDISEDQFPLLNEEVSKAINPALDEELIKTYGFGKDDFEIALTRLDVDIVPNSTFFLNLDRENRIDYHVHKHQLKEKREKILVKYTQLFSMKGKEIKCNNTAKVFIEKIIKEDAIVLTTNYETYLENLLGPKKWSCNGGYGKILKYPAYEENERLSNMEPHGFTAVVPEKPAAASRLPLGKAKGRRGPPPTCCGDISP